MGMRDEWNEIAKLRQHHMPTRAEKTTAVDQFVVDMSLDKIEIHAADHCVQRCKMCSHAADMAPKKLYGPEDYVKSFERLKEKGIKIKQIEILGGEPFINPRLEEIVDMARNFTDSVAIMSNMFWLKSFYDIDVRASIFDKIQVLVSTFYEPLVEKCGGYDKTMYLFGRLKHRWQKIDYVSFVNGIVTSFASFEFSDEPKPIIRSKCAFRGCKQLLHDGRVLGCCAARRVMYTRPEIIDVFDLNTDFDPKDFIKWYYRKTINLCNYCSIATEGLKPFTWRLAD